MIEALQVVQVVFIRELYLCTAACTVVQLPQCQSRSVSHVYSDNTMLQYMMCLP